MQGRTPLHTACSHGRPTVAELLVEAGADVNALDNKVGISKVTLYHTHAHARTRTYALSLTVF